MRDDALLGMSSLDSVDLVPQKHALGFEDSNLKLQAKLLAEAWLFLEQLNAMTVDLQMAGTFI